MARCFVTRRLPGDALDRLAAEHDTEVWEQDDPVPREELLERAGPVEGLLTMLTDRVDAELLDASPKLRAVSNYAVGVDNIDVEAATARGIPVGHTPDVLTGSTADLAVGLMLAVARRIPEGDRLVRAGKWPAWGPETFVGRDLHGSTVGIVGFGRIGKALAERVRGFGATAVHATRSMSGSLDELLERADFVSLHVPLTPETRGMIDAAALERMKPSAYLVNTGRGPLVDTDALTRALHEGTIAGAALDVTDPEPLPADHPLLDAPNLVVVPHIGSDTYSTRRAMAELAVENLLAGLAGKPMPRSVNPPAP
jgi:lactate dehydrogenase-like 2-hydroxyacid dehydrogenase